MSNIIYLTMKGEKQGLISSGCSSIDSIGNHFQSIHQDEIMVYELSNNVSRVDNVAIPPVKIRKPIDKATPLLAQALAQNEKLECVFSFYRAASYGSNECYFKIILKDAIINNITFLYPNAIICNEVLPYESVSFKFASIVREHVTARTSSHLPGDNAAYCADRAV